jgi:predicted nucleic acid-binding protein
MAGPAHEPLQRRAVGTLRRTHESKRGQVRELVAGGRLVLSSQVLSEFYVTVTRKLARPLDPVRAGRAVGDLCALPVWDVTANLVQAAIRRCAATPLSYWDALILETALDAGATTLLTEELQHGQVVGTLRVHNPFLAS